MELHPALTSDQQPNTDVMRAWGFDMRVVYFRVKGGGRRAMEAAVALIADTVTNWPPEKPLRVIYDVSEAVLTPQSRKAATDVYDIIPTHFTNSRTAIVLPGNFVGNILRSFGERFYRVVNPDMERRFFTKLDRAIKWVADDLPPTDNADTPPPANKSTTP